MGDLANYLRYLGRDDVREILLQSGRVPALRLEQELRPLSQNQLSTADVVDLLIQAGLSAHLPTDDTRGTPKTVAIETHSYDVIIARQKDLLQVRIGRAGTWTNPGGPPSAAPDKRSPPSSARPRVERQRSEPPESSEAVPPPSMKRPPLVQTMSVPRIDLSESRRAELPSHPPKAPEPAAQIYSVPPKPAQRTVPGALFEILKNAREKGASDVHLSAENNARFRVVGKLLKEGPLLSKEEVEEMLTPVLSEGQKTTLREVGYTDFALELEGLGRLRVNVNAQRTGMKACFRLIGARPPTVAELGLPPEVRKLSQYHQGFAVVSGPNGQGKTTTLAALVDMLNTERAFHIITVEDPVEYIHPIKKAVISQREVGTHTASFASALKGSLREDPDVIIIGELRDRETVEMALSAAETGHLVIATMSTPSAGKTIDRLIDMFPPDDQAQVRATLAGALKMIIAQRLVPSVDGQHLHAAAELITGGVALWSLIRDNKLFQLPSLQQRGRNFGMLRIEDSLNALLEQGVISRETAEYFANDPRTIGQKPVVSLPPEAADNTTPDSKRGFFGRKN